MSAPVTILLILALLRLHPVFGLNLLLDLRGISLSPGDAVLSLSKSLYPTKHFPESDPFIDCLSIGGGGAIEGVDLDVGGLNKELDSPLCNVDYPVNGCLCDTASGNSIMLCGQGARKWGVDPTRALADVHVVKEDADNDSVLKAVEGIRAGKAIVDEDGEMSKTSVLDMDLLSLLMDVAQPSSIVARCVTKKSSIIPIFTKMSQEDWDGKKVETTKSGLLIPSEEKEEDATKKVCLKALVLPYDEGIWRSCLDIFEVINSENAAEVGV
mmetsp:Transcript_22005/g.45846  ORF Transcript_22005/g.45846 Transcript_22005/m.45846 type:complete len:269 (-) Transcript_22005:35-841(-)